MEHIVDKGEVLVKVEGASKKFSKNLKSSLKYGFSDIAGDIFGLNTAHVTGLRKDEFWAVSDISFELRRGECLGLIGHNGAGKSTLLKMLNGLIKPDKGLIEMRGRIGALIELGAGFNPILSGRENIYINAQILGFTNKEIKEKFDSIVEFAELGDYLEMPVQNYSSGMKVRLGFAVAAQMEPDVLIIDEVLAVGDVGFRHKCFGVIQNMMKRCAVIFVSHSMSQVGKICNVALLMSKGEVKLHSKDVGLVINEYHGGFQLQSSTIVFDLKVIVIKDATIKNILGIVGSSSRIKIDNDAKLNYGESVWFLFEIESLSFKGNIDISVIIYDSEAKAVCQLSSINTENFLISIQPNSNITVSVNIPCLLLNKGIYSVSCVVISKGYSSLRGETLLFIENILYFHVISNSVKHGNAPYMPLAEWYNSTP